MVEFDPTNLNRVTNNPREGTISNPPQICIDQILIWMVAQIPQANITNLPIILLM